MNFLRIMHGVAPLVVATAVLGTPLTVRAQAAPADTSAQADDLYKRGVDAFAEKKLEEAYGFLTRAWVLKQSPEIGANLALVELKLGKARDSAEHIAMVLRAYPVGGAQDTRDRLQAKLAEAKKTIATVHIRSNVDGATILVDGKDVGKTPVKDELYLEVGKKQLVARKEGYDDYAVPMDLTPGIDLQLQIEMTPGTKRAPTGNDKPIWPTIALAAGAAAGLGLGIGFTVSAEMAKGELEDSGCRNATCATTFQDQVDSYNLGYNIAIPAYAVGGAALIGMIVYLAVPTSSPPGPKEAAWGFSPWFGPTSSGVTLMGEMW